MFAHPSCKTTKSLLRSRHQRSAGLTRHSSTGFARGVGEPGTAVWPRTAFCWRVFAADLHCSHAAPAVITFVASTSASAASDRDDDTNRCVSMQSSRSVCSGDGAHVRTTSRGIRNADANKAIDAATYGAIASDLGRPSCAWLDVARPAANTSDLSATSPPCLNLRPTEPATTLADEGLARVGAPAKVQRSTWVDTEWPGSSVDRGSVAHYRAGFDVRSGA